MKANQESVGKVWRNVDQICGHSRIHWVPQIFLPNDVVNRNPFLDIAYESSCNKREAFYCTSKSNFTF